MIPKSVIIRYDKCELTLSLPLYFEETALTKIRKVFKILEERKYQNESARETLDQFFPVWEQDAQKRLARFTENQQEAEFAARNAQQQVACFGTMTTKEMKDDLTAKQKDLRNIINAVKRENTAVKRCEKIVADYKNSRN